jgi:hypothetical protein
MQQQQQLSATIDRGGSKQAPHALLVEKAVQVEAKQLTIVEYIKKYNPGQFEYLPDNPSFASEELWLDFQEARHNMVPQFRSDGTRIYHPALLGWCLDIEHSAESG